MTLNDRLESQKRIMEVAEADYLQSAQWERLASHADPAFKERFFHPYADIAKVAGQVLLLWRLHAAKDPKSRESLEGAVYAATLSAKGGAVEFDATYPKDSPINSLSVLSKHVSIDDESMLDYEAWERKVTGHAKSMLKPMQEALSLPDTPETEEATGMVREELLDLKAFVQMYLISRTYGLEAAERAIPELQRGESVYR